VELFLIAGADVVRDLGRWRGLDEILSLATLALAARPGHELELPPELRARRVDIAALPISSTEIRSRLGSGADASDLLDARVSAYIASRSLYRT
jgi:nicotinate-nucleotide adenylyltransferase